MNYSKEEPVLQTDVELMNHLPKIGMGKVKDEILQGLRAKQISISPKFFYDETGSDLFEEITQLEEYYPTRTEKSILATLLQTIKLDFQELNLIELGSGDCSKISLLLSQIPKDKLEGIHYFPVDISQSAIEKSAVNLLEEYPELNITGIVADFIHQLNILPVSGNRLICFLGSTIGNFTEEDQVLFIQKLSAEMTPGDQLLVGFDMLKDVAVIEEAYNDKKNITAAFNLNILNVVNRLSDSEFEVNNFKHSAFFNEEKSRIEMHLVSLQDQCIKIDGGKAELHIQEGQTIHTENSCKFNLERINQLGRCAGLVIQQIANDSKEWFSLVLFAK